MLFAKFATLTITETTIFPLHRFTNHFTALSHFLCTCCYVFTCSRFTDQP